VVQTDLVFFNHFNQWLGVTDKQTIQMNYTINHCWKTVTYNMIGSITVIHTYIFVYYTEWQRILDPSVDGLKRLQLTPKLFHW